MRLTRHLDGTRTRWAADGIYLARSFRLSLVAQSRDPGALIAASRTDDPADGPMLAPIDDDQELWAAGVTYLRSRAARAEESDIGARLYEHVYEAERPELFFKAMGERVVGDGGAIRIRRDSTWDVPEPELTVLVNDRLEPMGYTAGNDVSSRSIEGENALYLPQAKVFDGSAAVGAGIRLCAPGELGSLAITLTIRRGGETVFEGDADTSQLKRTVTELAAWTGRELRFEKGFLMMTGTCIVPGDGFTLAAGDEVSIRVGEETLTNRVE